jgi:L-cysteine desulfidase
VDIKTADGKQNYKQHPHLNFNLNTKQTENLCVLKVTTLKDIVAFCYRVPFRLSILANYMSDIKVTTLKHVWGVEGGDPVNKDYVRNFLGSDSES